MALEIIYRSIVAAIWGAPPWKLDETEYAEGGSDEQPPPEVPFGGSVVGRNGDRSAREPDRGVSVADQAGQLAAVDHNMAARSRAAIPGAFRDVFRDDPRGLGLESLKRPPWHPGKG